MVDGRHRLTAALMLNLKTVPALVLREDTPLEKLFQFSQRTVLHACMLLNACMLLLCGLIFEYHSLQNEVFSFRSVGLRSFFV